MPHHPTLRSSNNEQRPARKRLTTLRGIIDAWWDRLFSTIFGGTWNDQPSMYESGQAGKDYLLNTLGSIAWGALFPLLTIVSTQLTGVERAGEFNMAFTTATLLLYIGNYGVKTYQISDIDETHSFASYQVQRLLTCLIMLAAGFGYCAIRHYSHSMLIISAGAYALRVTDALADTCEARLQQQDKLYLAGISVAVRSVLAVTSFSLLLLITRNLSIASAAMGVAAVFSLIFLTVPLTYLETPRSRRMVPIEIREITVDCFPAFLALFLFALIENIPKYAMEGVLPYESQVYFSAIFFPSQAILMAVGFVYRPQLVKLATIWSDPQKRLRFDFIVLGMIGVCALFTLCGLALARWVLVPLNSMLYAVDFETYRDAQYLMVLAGGFSAGIDFLYQIITILRKQRMATRTYLGMTALTTVVAIISVRFIGFYGAVWSYTGAMLLLFIALGVLYILARVRH